MLIREIISNERPREKLERYGVSSLTNTELLAIILQTGTKGESVLELSSRLTSQGLEKLNSLSLNELKQIKGIGIGKASQILSLFELNKRISFTKNETKPIKSAKDVFNYCSPKLSNLDKEHFMILHLNTKNKVIRDEIISIGTLNSSLIHPREVFKSAIKDSSNSIILVHNHPSGDIEPSDEDKEVTKILTQAGELLNIKVLDHVIIGKKDYYSFKN
ncbi:MAG: DNA repair protein RadC [Candidatus Woesearchaeota archaeon]